MLVQIASWFLIFIIYSFIGWIFEIIVALVSHRKFSNRGFLIGPICPIYGVGAVLISLLLGNVENAVAIFCVSMVGAVALEYFTSWLMETLFHARWWDYRDMPFNLNGRICLHTGLAFGVLGVLVVRVTNPLLLEIFNSVNQNVLIALFAITLGLLLIDIFISFWMIINFRVTVGTVERDATDEISARVRQIMMEKGRASRRLVKAFPNLEPKRKPARSKTSKSAKSTKTPAKPSK